MKKGEMMNKTIKNLLDDIYEAVATLCSDGLIRPRDTVYFASPIKLHAHIHRYVDYNINNGKEWNRGPTTWKLFDDIKVVFHIGSDPDMFLTNGPQEMFLSGRSSKPMFVRVFSNIEIIEEDKPEFTKKVSGRDTCVCTSEPMWLVGGRCVTCNKPR